MSEYLSRVEAYEDHLDDDVDLLDLGPLEAENYRAAMRKSYAYQSAQLQDEMAATRAALAEGFRSALARVLR